MKHIHVDLGKDSYDIHIENGLLDRAGDYIRNLTKSRTLAVITDSNVDALYGQRLGRNINARRRSSTSISSSLIPALPAATTSSPSAAASLATSAASRQRPSCAAFPLSRFRRRSFPKSTAVSAAKSASTFPAARIRPAISTSLKASSSTRPFYRPCPSASSMTAWAKSSNTAASATWPSLNS